MIIYAIYYIVQLIVGIASTGMQTHISLTDAGFTIV